MAATMVLTQHTSYVHHMALDVSGSLLATCASDRTVEVYYHNQDDDDDEDENRGTGSWELGCVMRDHTGPVIRVAWCPHIEHGPLLVTAGADRWIHIYRITMSTHEGKTLIQADHWAPHRGFEKDVITDVSFVPPQQHHLLLLSTASLDGVVRLYEMRRQSQIVFFARILPEATMAGEVTEELRSASPLKTSVSSPTSAGKPLRDGRGGVGVGSVGNGSTGDHRVSNPGGTGATREAGGGNVALRTGGITAIAWFPGATEARMTLAVGAVSGRCYLYRFCPDTSSFGAMSLPSSLGLLCCASPIADIKWAPVLGRRFQMLAICARTEVLILRLNCFSLSGDEREIGFELYRHSAGAVSVEWARSATLLYLIEDSTRTRLSVLQMANPLDHQSWHVVAQNSVPL